MTRRACTASALFALALATGGCAMSDEANGHEAAQADDAADSVTENGADDLPAPGPELPEWRKMWNFGDPAGTAERFEEAIAAGEAAGDREYVLIVTTQLARTQGLQRDFDRAHEILDGVETELEGRSAELRMRYLLERGRTTNSSGSPEKSVPYFEEAWEVGLKNGEDVLAVDAAHMLAIVLPGDQQLAWSEKAMALAEASNDERCKGWLGPLYQNTGWTYHNMGDLEKALATWQKCLAYHQERDNTEQIWVARWLVARCWRSMGRYQDALAEQKSILDDRVAAGSPGKGYCEEEIGENLWALGRREEARDWYGKAWDLLKDDKWMQSDDAERLARMKERGGR
jgi:tetratricopeptide (TPR) repeat protein